jgi:hypothetical protein
MVIIAHSLQSDLAALSQQEIGAKRAFKIPFRAYPKVRPVLHRVNSGGPCVHEKTADIRWARSSPGGDSTVAVTNIRDPT